MDRRQFMIAGCSSAALAADPSLAHAHQGAGRQVGEQQDSVRSLFPRLEHEIYLNAASGTPQGAFAADGMRRFEEYWRLGNVEGRSYDKYKDMDEAQRLFAKLIGADVEEIGFVSCTKAGEQLVLDGLPRLRERTGNVVTNDLHFAGSLHNLIGLRASGLEVRIVKAENWSTPIDAMRAAIDDDTALVAVTHVSNVNGHVEALADLSEIAHAHGALVYADLIQSAGSVPIDVRALGIDFAACSAYKWLFGTHGIGFFYARRELQGTRLPDHMVPGHARHNYDPWVPESVDGAGDFLVRPRKDASRYMPGHPSYVGISALHEGLKFIHSVGVENALQHSVALNARLLEGLDADRFPCISPHLDRSPILALTTPEDVGPRLRAAGIAISLGPGRLRISPSIYNTEDDMDRLAAVLSES